MNNNNSIKTLVNLLTVVLFVIIVLFAFAQQSYATEEVASGTCGDNLTWVLTGPESDMLLTIKGSGNMTNYDADTAAPWYDYRDKFKTVVVDDGVTSIGGYAFHDCSSLTSITIPEGVTSIGDSAFQECRDLTSITIPNSVTSIGDDAFAYCSDLASITIPDGVTSIGNEAFSNCNGLTSITIPEGVTIIGDNVFRNCESLTSITIPEGVTSIGDSAFDGCIDLTSIVIPESVMSIGDFAFSFCGGLTNITIPESVTSIGNYTFQSCDGLTSITIPEGVTSIGDDAFAFCNGLASITIPNSVTSIGYEAFYDCNGLTSITIPNSVTSIGDYAFQDCSSLTNIIIPEGVTSIAEGAFQGCSSLTSITIPENVTSIGWGAFAECSSLTSITIPDSVTSIGVVAFAGCSSLTSIVIPEGVTNIGNDAFEDCSSLKYVFYKGTEQQWVNIGDNKPQGTVHYSATDHTYGGWSVKVEPTCTEAGSKEKTCTVCEYAVTEEIPIDPEAHDWDKPEWDWSVDHSSASAKFTCKNDSSHTETMNAEVTVFIDDSGGTFYTAKVLIKGKEYKKTFTTEESKRIYGTSRYDTAIKAADEYKAATGSKFENVVVAYGKNFPDALSGGYLAKVKNAPILLVEPKQEDRIADYISENIADGGTVYILGGEGAVSSAFENKVKDKGIIPVRLGGATRYETNLKILGAAEVTNQEILVCTGTGYADSLSASAVGKPILLVGKTLTDEQKTYIGGLNSQKFYLIGGEGAVNTAIENELKDLGYNVDRIAGASRYETSTEVAKKFLPEAKTVVLAYAKNFPDGLSGGPLAMKKNAPIILTDSSKTEAAAKYVEETGAAISITLGGSSLISDKAATAIMGS